MAMYTIIEINNDHLDEIAGNPNIGECIARICRNPSNAQRIREDYSIPNIIRVVGLTGEHVYAGHTRIYWEWKPPQPEDQLSAGAKEAFRKFCDVTDKLPRPSTKPTSYIEVKARLTRDELTKYVGDECSQYVPGCVTCKAWVQWHNDKPVTLRFEREAFIKFLNAGE